MPAQKVAPGGVEHTTITFSLVFKAVNINLIGIPHIPLIYKW